MRGSWPAEIAASPLAAQAAFKPLGYAGLRLRWCGAALRALPIPDPVLRRSDASVVALGLLPLLALYAVGAAAWWVQRPAWLLPWARQAGTGWLLMVAGSWLAGRLGGDAGRLTWLRGANGSGKSTLLALLALLAGALRPICGHIAVNGIAQAGQPLAYRREVFWCGPGPVVFEHLRPPEYFGFIAGLYPRFDAQALAGHVRAFGLAPHLGQRLSALSTGTQRKVALATALAVGTAVMLLDEPFNALDAASLAHLQGSLQAAAACTQQAWLVASHPDPAAGGGRAVLDLDAGPAS